MPFQANEEFVSPHLKAAHLSQNLVTVIQKSQAL
jgi:hypothetical protein